MLVDNSRSVQQCNPEPHLPLPEGTVDYNRWWHVGGTGAAGEPLIVAGDFNTFWGENEIYLFMRAAGLMSANVDSIPTYPSRAPRKELDFILFQEGIEVKGFEVPDIKLSDHLPLVCDFEVA